MGRSTGAIVILLGLSCAALVRAQDVDAGVLPPPSAVTDEAGIVLARRVDGFYSRVTALRAHIVQRFHHRVHERDVDAEGTLTLRRPDRMRVLYDGGRGLSVEGTTFRAYEPEGSLVHEGELPEEALFDLLGVLSGATSVEGSFDVRALPSRDEGDVLEVRPRIRSARWDRAILLVATDGSISRILVVDPAGSWLRVHLRDVEYPRSIPSGELTLPVPDDALVISP